MKKYFILILLSMFFALNGQAQAWKNLLGKAANKVTEKVAESGNSGGVVSNILGSIIGNSIPFSKSLIEGTWNYDGFACVLESESALSNIGGTVVTSQIEDKLDGYLSKVGISKGSCKLTFFPNDSCCFSVNERELSGTYKLNAEEKIIDFSFLRDKLKMKSYLSYNVSSIDVVFDADKLLTLIKNVTSTVSDKTSLISSNLSASSASQLNTVGTALDAASTVLSVYDGMMLGMKLTK